MSSNFKVDIMHREVIKPSSPTPPHLKTLKLSLLDQLTPEIYSPFIYFYPNHDSKLGSDKKSSILKNSLSETLTHFYPFAGEFIYNDSICCDDRGASFIEAKINCKLSDFLQNPDAEKIQSLIAVPLLSTQADVEYLVLVQASFFECGGMAIGVSISHKLGDGFTINSFVKSWSAIARGASNDVYGEFGVTASIFPPQDFLSARKPAVEFKQKEKCTTRRFLFDAARLDALKIKATRASVAEPTRVEVVSALIWKCTMEALREKRGLITPSSWRQAMNLRREESKNALGNLIWSFQAKALERKEYDLQSLVEILRKCKDDYRENYPDGITPEDVCKIIKESSKFVANKDMDYYACTSLCQFPVYETNFGWGNPAWVSNYISDYKNTISLMDAHDGNGIDAYVTFLEEDMARVESNPDLLAYASVNPSIKCDF